MLGIIIIQMLGGQNEIEGALQYFEQCHVGWQEVQLCAAQTIGGEEI